MFEQSGRRQPVRARAKTALARVLSRSSRAILINSFGRSGSTVLHEGIVTSASVGQGAINRLSRHVVRGVAWDLQLDPIGPGACYKTHDYPPRRSFARTPRLVYAFGDPVDATVSLIRRVERDGQEWLNEHCAHLRIEPFDVHEVIDRDALHVEEHMRAWLAFREWDVAFVRYERLWENVGNLGDFLGFDVELPAKRERASVREDQALIARLEETYAGSIRLVESLPDYFVV